MQRSSVVLPQPDGPTTHMISLRRTCERQLVEGDHGAVEEQLAGAVGDDGGTGRCFPCNHAFPHPRRRPAPRRRALIRVLAAASLRKKRPERNATCGTRRDP